MGKVKDISPDFAYFQELQSLYERYGINIGDADNKFRPNNQMTEKEFYSAMGTIFAVDYNREFSAVKTVSRGEFAYSLAKALDLTVDVINKAKKKSADAKLSAKIKSLPSKGKAKIVKYLLAYLPDNTCVDLKSVSREIEIAAYKGGVWGDYKIKNDDIGDIVFEADNTCKKGEKLVLLRVGTAIVTISEKGIKRIK